MSIQGQRKVQLNNGIEMPLLGLGVYDMYKTEAEQAINWALVSGYRLIDTASMYNNEVEVGNAVKSSGICRNEIFITTKVNSSEQGFDNTLRAYDRSLKKLQTDYVDLYLIHWPIRQFRKETWLALERLYAEKRVKAIGVANYLAPFLDELFTYSSFIPSVNQVEFSPFLYLHDLHDKCKSNNIQLQAYTPLVRGERLKHPVLVSIGERYDKTSAQVILRWLIQLGISAIPKSARKERIIENSLIFDFSLTPEEMKMIGNLNENYRIVDDPMTLF